MPEDHTLTIERLTCCVNLAAGQAYSGEVRHAVERLARQELKAAIKALDLPLETGDETVYRLRSLKVDLWVQSDTGTHAPAAGRWSRAIGAALLKALQRGDPALVARFESPQDYLLHFLRHLVDGQAWGRWYYTEFSVLRSLADEQAALELLIQRPAWIAGLLQALMESGHGERLLARWRAVDLDRLWAALGFTFLAPSAPNPPAGLAQLLPARSAAALSGGTDAEARSRDTLRLWLASTAQDAPAYSLARMLVDLGALIRRVPETGGLLLMQSKFYPALISSIEANGMRDILAWLLPLNRTQAGRARLAQTVEAAGFRLGPRIDAGSFSSPAGSIALLALGLAGLGVWETWIQHIPESEARRFLFVLALKALGFERAPLYLEDRSLAAFAGMEEPPVADARLPLEVDTGPPAWLEDLPGLAARFYPMYTWQLTAWSVQGMEVLRDRTCGGWLAARPTTGRPLAGWAVGLPAPGLPDEAVQRKLEAEAGHLLLGQRLGYPWLTPSLDAALAATTSLALRLLAARIPNFEASSPAYLAAQFLAQPARWIPGPDHWQVRLSGGPLRVALSLAEIPERLNVPWLPLALSFDLPEAGRLG
jgi:hypothetical protein